jgi:hypothetical protein
MGLAIGVHLLDITANSYAKSLATQDSIDQAQNTVLL